MHNPDFERVLTALRCGKPDRVPVMELKMDLEIKEAFLGRQVRDAASDVEFWWKAGYDYIRIRPSYKFRRKERIGESTYSVYSDKAQRREWGEEGLGTITDLSSFEAYEWLDPGRDVDYSAIEEAAKYLPPKMKIIGSINGIFENVWWLMGLEGFSYALAENPRLVWLMFERVGSILYEIFRRIIEMPGVGAMWLADDIAYVSGTIVSPEVLRKYLFPWFKKLGELCLDYNVPFIYHSDGKLWDVMEDLLACHINALQPIEPKAMSILDVKKAYGDKLCLIGNIDLGYTLTRGTSDEVRAEVKERIRELAPAGGYCVGSSNTVTNYVPLENFKAMVEATFEYGKYPINI